MPINVLVVDDSLVSRGMIVNLLEKDPAISIIDAVANAAEADKVLRRKTVDVVTLDLEMPGMSGMDFLPLLAERDIPTVILSSQITSGSAEEGAAIRKGAYACFSKANAVRKGPSLIKQIKEAAANKGRNSARKGEAPDEEESARRRLSLATKLIDQHGPETTRVLAEHVGHLALRSEVKHIETWRAIATQVGKLLSEAKSA